MGRRPAGFNELREAARRRIPQVVFDYIDGAADDELTARENRRAFEDLSFRARVLVDVAERSQEVEVLGQRLRVPVITAPTGMSRVAGGDGEIAAARGAVAAGTVSILSGATSIAMQDVAASVDEPQWFQLYLFRDRERSVERIELARELGFRVLVVTVDTPVPGNRERDVRNGLTIPVHVHPRMAAAVARRPRWLLRYLTGPPLAHHHDPAAPRSRLRGVLGDTSLAEHVGSLFNPSPTWDDIAWVREMWHGPLAVKGVMSGEDAARAVEAGCDGVVVSNHGGRQLDGLPATIDVLPEVVRAVGDRADVLLDSGVRRGTDVVKALALGARACLIGRPWLFGLASGGVDGVVGVLEGFHAEIDRTLALLGVADARDLHPGVLRRRPGSGWEDLV